MPSRTPWAQQVDSSPQRCAGWESAVGSTPLQSVKTYPVGRPLSTSLYRSYCNGITVSWERLMGLKSYIVASFTQISTSGLVYCALCCDGCCCFRSLARAGLGEECV